MIVLSAGHFPASPGASFGGRSEHFEACRWVAIIGDALTGMGAPFAVCPTGHLPGKVAWINAQHAIAPIDLCVEIHFNSDPTRQGDGSETLYCPGSMNGMVAAQIVQGAMGAVMLPNRGIKEGWYRQDVPGHVDYVGDVEGDEKIDFFLKKTDPWALILEPEFIHRGADIDRLRSTACEIIASALVRAVETVLRRP